MKTTRLRVVLCDVEPALARVIDVPATATLPELHDLLQAAIGWTNSHLHQFVRPEATYGMDIPGAEVWPEDQHDETTARLADLGNRFEYLYDFGDGWTHDVEVRGPGAAAPGCAYGYGACPPEDCGGPGGYAELLHTSNRHTWTLGRSAQSLLPGATMLAEIFRLRRVSGPVAFSASKSEAVGRWRGGSVKPLSR